jgi:hypothetical protein
MNVHKETSFGGVRHPKQVESVSDGPETTCPVDTAKQQKGSARGRDSADRAACTVYAHHLFSQAQGPDGGPKQHQANAPPAEALSRSFWVLSANDR